MRNRTILLVAVLVAAAATPTLAQHPSGDRTATPEPMVAAYSSLADTMLAAKKTEWNLVHTILATTYSHAEATAKAAKAKIAAGQDVRGDIEVLAALVAQLGNEGDASVAAVRKRLLEGGHHHHHAAADKPGEYDEGFVIVTRAAKKTFLDAAGKIARLGDHPDAAALDAEWSLVAQEFTRLHADHSPSH